MASKGACVKRRRRFRRRLPFDTAKLLALECLRCGVRRHGLSTTKGGLVESAPSTKIGRIPLPQGGRIPLVAVVYALGVGLFLTLEPTRTLWLVVATLIVALGTDGIIRSYAHGTFRAPLDTAPHLVVPVILSFAVGFFLEETVSGYWDILAAVVAGGLMAGILFGECLCIDVENPLYGTGRFLLNIATYLGAFALYAVMYSYGIGLAAAGISSGLVSAVLAAEILRETDLMPPPVGEKSLRSLGFAAAIGLIIAEVRWSLYFVPLEGFLAAVFLLLFFYVATGIAQHHLTGHLSRIVVREYALVASLGLLMVVLGRALGGG